MNKHFIDISKCFNRHHKPWICHFIKVTPVSLNTFTRKHLHAAFGLRFDHVSYSTTKLENNESGKLNRSY